MHHNSHTGRSRQVVTQGRRFQSRFTCNTQKQHPVTPAVHCLCSCQPQAPLPQFLHLCSEDLSIHVCQRPWRSARTSTTPASQRDASAVGGAAQAGHAAVQTPDLRLELQGVRIEPQTCTCVMQHCQNSCKDTRTVLLSTIARATLFICSQEDVHNTVHATLVMV